MELKLTFDNEKIGQQLNKNMGKAGQQMREAMRGAANDAAQEIMARGADDIENAGNFGSRWQDALDSEVSETQRTFNVETKMVGGPPVSYWRVFEYGATITPKNAKHLWIPFSGTEGTDVWPRAYDGDLSYFVTPNGLPILKDKDTNVFLYHGHDSVTIPQKFHLREIIKDVSRELRQYYAEHMRG